MYARRSRRAKATGRTLLLPPAGAPTAPALFTTSTAAAAAASSAAAPVPTAASPAPRPPRELELAAPHRSIDERRAAAVVGYALYAIAKLNGSQRGSRAEGYFWCRRQQTAAPRRFFCGLCGVGSKDL